MRSGSLGKRIMPLSLTIDSSVKLNSRASSKDETNTPLLAEYDSIIQHQLKRRIIEVVNEKAEETTDRVHYMPHHSVVQPGQGDV